MKRKRLKWSERYKPTKESIAEQNRRHELYDYYGIPIGIFTSNDELSYTKQELEAMQLIIDNKPIPNKLKQELLSTKKERQLRRNIETIDKQPEHLIVDKDLHDYIKSKLK